MISTVVYFVLKDGPTMLSNAEKLPAAIVSVKEKFLGWYYEDEAWSGMWSASREGDTEDLKLSDVDLRIDIDSKQGQIGGTIATKTICQALPVFDFLLVEGSISGSNKAEILVYDWVGGKRTKFARLTLRREGVVRCCQ